MRKPGYAEYSQARGCMFRSMLVDIRWNFYSRNNSSQIRQKNGEKNEKMKKMKKKMKKMRKKNENLSDDLGCRL